MKRPKTTAGALSVLSTNNIQQSSRNSVNAHPISSRFLKKSLGIFELCPLCTASSPL